MFLICIKKKKKGFDSDHQLEAALVHDGVQLLAKALHDMGRSQEVTPKSFSCDGIDTWAQGNNLIHFIKTVGSFI